MRRDYGRIARAALAPRAIIFGLAAFLFGWALMEYLRTPERQYYREDEQLNLFIAFALLAASAGLAAGRPWSKVLSASLSSPLPLVHAYIFWGSATAAKAHLFSGAHLRFWAERLADMTAVMWLSGALSFAIFLLALPSALRQSARSAPTAPHV